MKTPLRRLFGRASGTALLFALGSVAPALATSNLWYDKYVTLEATVGDDYYNNPTSNALAWGESYTLESYLDLYQLTGDTAWLNKLTSHVTTMLSNASDLDGDSYLGWSTSRYAPQRAVNGSFETAASGDTTMAANWTRWQSTSATAYRFTSPQPPNYNASSNTRAFAILSNGTSWQRIYQNIGSYDAGQKYTFKLYGRLNASTATAGAEAYVLDATTGTKLATLNFTTTTWTLKAVDFIAPAAGHTLQIWLSTDNYTGTGGAYFDQVSLQQYFEYVVHDGAICRPIAGFIRLVNETPALQAAYLSTANTYQAFLENEIVPKWTSSSFYGNCWVSSGTTEGYYRFPPSKNSYVNNAPGDIVPYNMMLVFADMLNDLYAVTGTASYLDKAQRIGTYFKNRLTLSGSHYLWTYRVGGSLAGNPEDTSHGAIDINCAVRFFRDGRVFNGTDMERFTDTLIGPMWNDSSTAPTVAENVDGTGSTTIFTRTLTGWLELSQFSMTVPVIGEEQYRSFTPTSVLDLRVLGHIMKWDRSKIVNQGFELKTSADATHPAQWNRVNATSATMYLDSANAYAGNYGLTVKANGTTAQLAQQTWTKWLPSTSYTLSFMAKTDGTAAGGKVYVKNDTTGVVLATVSFTDTAWTAKSVTFTSPASTSDIVRTYIGNNNITVTNGKAHVDNIKLKVTSDPW